MPNIYRVSEKKPLRLLVRWFLFLGFFLGIFNPIRGQKLSVETALHVGQIVKHTPKIEFGVNEISWALESNFLFQTKGEKNWHQWQRYPEFGIAFQYFNFGQPDVLGEGFGVVPNLVIRGKARERFQFHFMAGAGVIYLTEAFNPIDNRLNNAIGSNFNSSIAFRFGWRYPVSNKMDVVGGFSFSHFSNGSAQLPNLGINIPAGFIGVRYLPKGRPTFSKHELNKKEVEQRWGLNVALGLAYKEFIVHGGPRYPVYQASVSTSYLLNQVNRLHLGIGYEWNQAVYEFGLHTYAFNSKAEAFRESARYTIFVADEFLFDPFSIWLQLGTYLNESDVSPPPWFLFSKLGIRYYFPPIGQPAGRFHIGVYLKAHRVAAEYLGFAGGVSF